MEIRKIESQEELLKVVEVEQAAWQFEDALECTPPHVMQASNKVGGFVLGAFYENKLVGFAYTIPAFDAQFRCYHHMHSLGVTPEARHLHPGYALLKAHHRESLQMGIDKITWTFDPLESRNANLYIRKVRAVVESPYIANMYGDSLLGGINAGIPADRFIATWHLNHQETNQQEPSSVEELIERYPLLTYQNPDQDIPQKAFLLEIPANFQQLKEDDFAQALAIRKTVRGLATQALNKGRKVQDFYALKLGAEERRNFYLFDE